MWAFLVALPVLLYFLAVGRRLFSWHFLVSTTLPDNNIPQNFISVIVPVRNEEKSILLLLQDLTDQDYPSELMEVIVVDDHSEDETAVVVRSFMNDHPEINIQIINSVEHNKSTGKKAAIANGIAAAKGEVLVFTDGDCRVSENWLALMEFAFRKNDGVCVSGPVCFSNADSVFGKLQLIEFSSLIGIGAASIALNSPNMCNGANIGYKKSAFLAVNGFSGNEHLASGDDEFVMHKLHEKYPGKIVFLKAAQATVYTESQQNLNAFVQQRVRWASKWQAYKNWRVKLLAVVVFAANLALPAALLLLALGQVSFFYFISLFALKFVIDFLFLYFVLAFFGKKELAWYSMPLQLVYVPYVLYTALKGLKGKYTWKGRTITNS